ncbi:hypothetical protein Ocin01_10744 [Orchesella cincta]|uniref:Uncharacterized protein n=1 Tax=Orchesella cincta TaxID=48709 RepID=A0A1D2MSC4_ORCCI|nr:hypothetical protein Ocin01_10744 [Orchesella cincta]
MSGVLSAYHILRQREELGDRGLIIEPISNGDPVTTSHLRQYSANASQTAHLKTSHQHSTSANSSMLLLQPQVSLPGFTELPGFLDALVDAESVLVNSDSESEFLTPPSGGPSSFVGLYDSPDFLSQHHHHHHHHFDSLQSGASCNNSSSIYSPPQFGSSSGNYCSGNSNSASSNISLHRHIMMDENSNSSSNGTSEPSGMGQSPSCFLLDSTSLGGSVSMEQPEPVGTPLPSFQETYSPRYRRSDVFSFEECTESPPYHQQPTPGSSGSSTPHTPTFQHAVVSASTSSSHQPPPSPASSTTTSPLTPVAYHHHVFYSPSSPTFEVLHSPPPQQQQPMGQPPMTLSKVRKPTSTVTSSTKCQPASAAGHPGELPTDAIGIADKVSPASPMIPQASSLHHHIEPMDTQHAGSTPGMVKSPSSDKLCAVCGDTAACHIMG